MHNGNWNDHMDGNGWWWIPMMVLMVAFVGALVWLVVVLARGAGHTHVAANGPAPAAPIGQATRPTAHDILAERLARGEIEPDDYRRRLEALAGSAKT